MANSAETQRLARIQDALNVFLVHEKFTLSEIKERLASEDPRYVTRLVRQLEREGLLRDEEGLYSWTCDMGEFPARAWVDAQIHGTQLPQTPEEDRPRERLLSIGPAALKTEELLAILIRTGRRGESALQAGQKIASRYKDRLHRLSDAGRGDLKDITSAIGPTAYCQIMAGIELGRRVALAYTALQQPRTRISGSEDALAFCRVHFARLASDAVREEFHIICVDAQHQFLADHTISIGCLDRSLVHPREVFRPAIKDAAKAILLVHNHPSGDPTPSPEDLAVTRRLEEAGNTLGIQVLDHIVVGRDGAASIQELRRRS